ncbi:MAG TPA: serine/threonine-protein kinase, partial [Pirellulales bacterium]|nr:serine/threonine-protein kinase [Pirellulales bacterium]
VPKVAVGEKSRARFLREIDLLRNLRHPQICALLDLGAVDYSFFFIMDYCSGGSLAELVKNQGGRLKLNVALPLLRQSLVALEYAHEQGIVHRDLKPENILLHQHSARWEARIADFGLAKQFEQAGLSGMTVTGAFGGTFEYMPREQLTDFRSVRPTCDIWSIAATFYRVLTGASARPQGPGRDAMEVVLRDEAVPIRQVDPAIPPPLAAVIDRALAADGAARFPAAGAMREAFDQAIRCPQ